MSYRTIILPEETYKVLLEVAREQGLSPENWIASQLSEKRFSQEPLSEKIGDLIGAIDSQAEPHYPVKKTTFGEQLATKLSKQGIKRS